MRFLTNEILLGFIVMHVGFISVHGQNLQTIVSFVAVESSFGPVIECRWDRLSICCKKSSCVIACPKVYDFRNGKGSYGEEVDPLLRLFSHFQFLCRISLVMMSASDALHQLCCCILYKLHRHMLKKKNLKKFFSNTFFKPF